MAKHVKVEIPARLLARYVSGEVTSKEVARELQISRSTVLDRFRALGVDTSNGRYYARRLALLIERKQTLPSGTAVATVASLYRSGLSTYQVARRLGCERQAACRLMHREGVPLRPRWYREVFRTPEGQPRSMRRFSAKLLELRHGRQWSQHYLGLRCGLSKTTIGNWECGKKGPSWRAVRRLVTVLQLRFEDLGITWKPVL